MKYALDTIVRPYILTGQKRRIDMTPSEQSRYDQLMTEAKTATAETALELHNRMDDFVADMDGLEERRFTRAMVRLSRLAFEHA